MTRDDIIRMAREADLTYTPQAGWVVGSVQRLERFAALVAAHEREVCAEIARKAIPKEKQFDFQITAGNTARLIEQIIRARGEA